MQRFRRSIPSCNSPQPGRGPTVALLLAALVGAPTSLAAPTLSWIFPDGARRGTSVVAEVHGSGLKEISGFFTTGKGVIAEVLPLSKPVKKGDPDPPDPDSVRSLRITVAPDAPLGGQEIRVFGHAGLSNIKMFQVGQWPELTETEPNDHLEDLKPIPVPVTMNGRIQNGSDQDGLRFTAKAGEQLTCEVYSERLLSSFDDSWLKGFLEVLNLSGKVLADNSGRFHWDPVIHFTAPQDGDYIVRFRDLLWRGNPAAVYRLTVGPIPYADALFPPGGQRGSAIRADFIGMNLGAQPSQTITESADDPDGLQDIRFSAPEGQTNPVVFQASDDPDLLEREPNDTDRQAQPVKAPVTINGKIEHPGDRDCFRVHVDANQRLVFEVFSDRAGSPLDSALTLRDSEGHILDENDDARERDSLLDRTFQKAGGYFIEVRDTNDRGGPDFTYRLRIGPPCPDFHLAATPDRVGVPAGGAARIDVKLNREWDFNEAVVLSVDGLPSDWRASSASIPKGSDHALLVLEAPPSAFGQPPVRLSVIGIAKLDGRTIRHTAAAEETYNLQGTAYRRQVIGPIAVATDPPALTLQPATGEIAFKAGSQATLGVKINRAAGIKGSVTLKLEELPEGVKAEPVVVAAEQEEGTFSLQSSEETAGAERDLLIHATLKKADGGESEAISRAIPLHFTEVPGFFLSVEPGELTLEAGISAELKIHVTRRGGFDGSIAIQMAGLPEGITASPAEIKAGEGEAKVTLTAAAKLTPEVVGKSVEFHVEGTGEVGSEKRNRSSGSVKVTVGK